MASRIWEIFLWILTFFVILLHFIRQCAYTILYMPDPLPNDGQIVTAEASPPGVPEGRPQAETDALADIFSEPGTESPDYGLIEQCDIDDNTRLLKIRKRLADPEGLAAKTGRELMESLLTGETIDLARLQLQLTGREHAQIVTMLQDFQAQGGPLTQRILGEMLLQNVKRLRVGEGSITTIAGLEKKTIEEGRRRMEGESLHVFVSSGLLALSAHEMGKRQFSLGAQHFNAAMVGNLGQVQDVEWYMGALNTSLQAMDVAGMTEADAITLQALKGDLFSLVRYEHGLSDKVHAAAPSALEGSELVYSKCMQAEAKLTELEAARKLREDQARQEKELEQFKVSSFKEQAVAAEATGKEWFKNGQRGYLSIDSESQSLFGKLLNIDSSIRNGYFDSRQNLEQMMGVLLRMGDEEYVVKAAAQLIDARSEYYDWSVAPNVMTRDLTTEQATLMMRDKMERHVYATAFGFLRSAFEYEVPHGVTPDYVNSMRLRLATTALTLVGKGRAQELLKTASSEKLKELGFSEAQIQFRNAFVEYIKSIPETEKSKATIVANSLRDGATRADSGVKEATERRNEELRKAAEARQTMTEAEASLRDVRSQIYRKFAEIDAVSLTGYLQQGQIDQYIEVRGKGSERRLEINSTHYEALQERKAQFEAILARENIPAERIQALEGLGDAEGRLRFMGALKAKLTDMAQRGKVGSGFLGGGGFVYSLSDFSETRYQSVVDVAEGTAHLKDGNYFENSIPKAYDKLIEKLEEARKADSGDPANRPSTHQVEDLAAEMNRLKARIQETFATVDKNVIAAIEHNLKHVFSRSGPIYGLSVIGGRSPFKGIVGQ